MCRSKENGGRRCQHDSNAYNARRRDRHAVKTARILIDSVIEEQGDEWVGSESIGLEINSPLVAKSYAIAVQAHAGVKRSSGEVYLNHPLRVARRLQENGFNEEVVAVALLHDAVEDSPLTLGKLRQLGFNERIISGVDSVTKREGEKYESAVIRAASHPIGRLVKLSDNLDNSSPEQLAPFSKERQERQKAKYEPARFLIMKSILERPVDVLIASGIKGFTRGYQIRIRPAVTEGIFA